jgi:hypothetical protein
MSKRIIFRESINGPQVVPGGVPEGALRLNANRSNKRFYREIENAVEAAVMQAIYAAKRSIASEVDAMMTGDWAETHPELVTTESQEVWQKYKKGESVVVPLASGIGTTNVVYSWNAGDHDVKLVYTSGSGHTEKTPLPGGVTAEFLREIGGLDREALIKEISRRALGEIAGKTLAEIAGLPCQP